MEPMGTGGDLSTLWVSCLDSVRDTVTESAFHKWLSASSFDSFEDGRYTVRFPNEFMARWARDHYGDFLERALRRLCGFDLRLVCVGDPAPPAALQQEAAGPPQQTPIRSNFLHPNYTFDRFVAGPSNQLAHAGALAVARNPGNSSQNPLFIYGGVGLGKTHLIQAIAHEIRLRHPSKKCVYTSSEQFLTLYISAIGRNRMDEFRRQFREVDLLLMDDVQFLAGKDQTQEEFFHRFNELYQNGRQIVLTSDRLPGEIHPLEERLVSRFQSGLVADIQSPDYETRMAILEMKVRDEGEHFPPDVLDYIASTVKSNVRLLEGAIHRLAASSRINGTPIDLALARRILAETFAGPGQKLSPGIITASVAEAFSVSPSQLRGKQRRRDILLPRQVAMFLIRELTDTSLVDIGRFFSGRDHSTVLNSIDRIRVLSADDPALKRRIQELRTRLSG